MRKKNVYTKTRTKQIVWKLKGDILDIKNTSAEREKNVLLCFQHHTVFTYPQTIDGFNMQITFFQRKRHVDINIDIVMGENNIFDKLIVMGNSRFADKSDGFANFLTVSRNFNFSCVYVFHIMYLMF